MRKAMLLLAFVICITCTAKIHAQASPYEQFITQALQAFEAGRWAEARSQFRRAHDLDPTARTLRTIGMCSFNLGDYPEAIASLEGALRDTRKPLTEELKTQVSELIAQANRKVGRFRLQVSPETSHLLVDGAAPVLLPSAELVVDAGRHELLISAAGYESQRRILSVEAGDRSLLEVQLQAQPAHIEPVTASAPPSAAGNVQPTTAEPAASTPVTPKPEQGNSTLRTLGYVSTGVGVAGLVTFAITGGLALSKKSDLDKGCPDRHCGPAHYDDLDSYDRLNTISSISAIAGGALLSLGIVLLLTSDGDSNAEHASITPQLGLGWAGIGGHL